MPPGSGRAGTSPVVVYFAKVPIAGQVKTRLCPPLTPVEAAALYGAFLRQVVVPVRGAKTLVYGWPEDCLGELRRLVPAEIEVRAQCGADLFERMARCMGELFAAGHSPVLIRNTDSPDLPRERIAEALERTCAGTAVFGPDFGGGYYLVSLAEPRPELFSAAGNDGTTVLARAETRARELGMAVERLAFERDVDSFDDLVEMWRARALRST